MLFEVKGLATRDYCAKGSREVVRKGSREVVLKPAVTYKMSSILVYSKIIGQRSAQRHVLHDWMGELTFLDLFQGSI